MNKKQYVTPELTVVTFKAERGYAGSQRFLSLMFGETGIAQKASISENWLPEENLFGENNEDNVWD